MMGTGDTVLPYSDVYTLKYVKKDQNDMLD